MNRANDMIPFIDANPTKFPQTQALSNSSSQTRALSNNLSQTQAFSNSLSQTQALSHNLSHTRGSLGAAHRDQDRRVVPNAGGVSHVWHDA
jgi:hypothetical protein